MKTFFCRHSSQLDIDQETLSSLWNDNYMAVHYPTSKNGWNENKDFDSLDSNDYSGSAKKAMNAINDISINGGYVFCVYRNINNYKIGYVEPRTKIELIKGTWGTKNGQSGREAILKAVKFKKSITINPLEALSLTCAQPRQGTLCIWKSVGRRVENFFNEISQDKTIHDLTPDLQEVFCSEFLRTNLDPRLPKVESFLTPIGRTMKDVDIIGITSAGKKVLAQVTYSIQPQWKIDKLLKYNQDKNCELILFSQTDHTKYIDNVMVYNIEEAFEKFTKSDIGINWIKHIL